MRSGYFADPERSRTLTSFEMVILEDCGHVSYVEQPEALFRAIRRFLDCPTPTRA